MYIEEINNPTDLKKLNIEELKVLNKEVREILLKRLSKKGGHIGSNLGFVEATIALHYVFDSPNDKFIFDVSHQTYVHKMLTGRKNAFIDEKDFDQVSGFSSSSESVHDLFNIGHTSTSISLATGVAKSRDLKHENYNVIAVIGDGSLGGGEAFEGLNYGSELKSNFIVVVNDNEMSIEENHGGLYGNLAELRETNGQAKNNFFVALGYKYFYLEEGNDLEKLVATFKKVKDSKIPVVLHIHTTKGYGFAPAIKDKEAYHAGGAFDIFSGKFLNNNSQITYQTKTRDYLINKMEEDPKFCVLTSGTAGILGFTPEIREKFPAQFIDVGIAEEDAVAMSSGIAKNGCTPVYFVNASFIQRAFDQLLQDLSMNQSPATIIVLGASINWMRAKTHMGLYDIPMISHIPGLTYLAPTSGDELFKILDWSTKQKVSPVIIRFPVKEYSENVIYDKTDYTKTNINKVLNFGKDIALFGVGDFFYIAEEVYKELKQEGYNPTLINPLFLTGLDTSLLDKLCLNHKVVVTIEDGIKEGGYGQTIASYLGKTMVKVLNYGFKKDFYDYFKVEDVLKYNRINKEDIIIDIKKLL
jgi:Deoxyxylulose-5-phosphate synthase